MICVFLVLLARMTSVNEDEMNWDELKPAIISKIYDK